MKKRSWEKRIGFVGVGNLGGAIARRMLRHGVAVTVFDPDGRAMGRVTTEGAKEVTSPREVGAISDIVFCCLPHPRVLYEVVLGEAGLLHSIAANSIVVDMSTSGPEAVQSVGKSLVQRGIRMIDAAVGKGPWAAEKGDLTIMMGGDHETCREVEPLIELVASKIYYCGPLGAGQVMKLINNLASCATLAVAIEAMALAEKAGANPDIVKAVLPQTAADSWHLRNTVIDKILGDRDFSPVFKLKLAQKDLQLAIAMAEKFNAPSTCARGALAWFERAVVAGYGDLDQGAIMLVSNSD